MLKFDSKFGEESSSDYWLARLLSRVAVGSYGWCFILWEVNRSACVHKSSIYSLIGAALFTFPQPVMREGITLYSQTYFLSNYIMSSVLSFCICVYLPESM